MGDQIGQTGGLASHENGRTGARSVSRDDAVASSADCRQPARPSLPHRVIRRLFHIWFRLSRGMTLGVRGLVLDERGWIFLVRHSYVPGWHLPGGGVEAGQTMYRALETELREEGNILLAGEPELFGIYHNHPAAPRDHVALYVVRHFRQTGPRLPDREIVECGFFAPEALPEETTAGTRRRIAEVLMGAAISPTW
jgi:ADP-ribose pyrophosphatase YjhB (NUDIX family)